MTHDGHRTDQQVKLTGAQVERWEQVAAAAAAAAVVGVCREDNPADVDEAYGAGTYARLFPDAGGGGDDDDGEDDTNADADSEAEPCR